MIRFPLFDLKKGFISVKVKLTVGLLLATALLVSIFGVMAWEHYQSQQEELRSTTLDNHAQEFSDQLQNISSNITYLFETQTLFSGAADLQQLSSYLNDNLPDLQWLLPIVNACIGSVRENMNCSAGGFAPPPGLVQQVYSKLKPAQRISCTEKCYLWVSLPVRLQNNSQGLLAFQLEIADALINVTRRDNIELAIVDLARLSSEPFLLTTSTQIKSHDWYALARAQLRQQSLYFNAQGTTVVGKLYPLIDAHENNLKLLVLKDWGHQLIQEQNFRYKVLVILLSTTAISILVGLALMRRPLENLRYHASNLPKVLEDQNYDPQHNAHLFHDEFDSLDSVSIELANNFKAMKENIEAHNRELQHMAMFDQLTGLPNRTSFSKSLGNILEDAKLCAAPVTLLYLDIDNFKTVNDTLGHEFGDQLILNLAMRIRQLNQGVDQLFRVGGDEFALIIYEQDQSSCLRFADSLAKWASRDLELADITVNVTVSVGIATATQASYDPQLLTKYADLAMYASKRAGRNCATHFELKLAEQNDLVFAIDTQFKEAISNDELELFMQPQISMLRQRIIGFELLLRWNHPTRGLLTPWHFLDTVENSRHIFPLGYWVIDCALSLLRELERSGYQGLSIAFNISGRQFEDKNFTTRLIRKFKAIDDPKNFLELEITESTAVENYPLVRAQLEEIREAGIKVAFDDFGKGFTSLSYLSNLPCDKIKFDREFGYDAVHSESSQKILLSMQHLMERLDYDVLVEGVEGIDHANWLLSQGFDKVQGYLFGKPVRKQAAMAALAMSYQRSGLFNEDGERIKLSPPLNLAKSQESS